MVVQLAPSVEDMNLALQGKAAARQSISLRVVMQVTCQTLSPDMARKFPRGLQLKDALAKPI